MKEGDKYQVLTYNPNLWHDTKYYGVMQKETPTQKTVHGFKSNGLIYLVLEKEFEERVREPMTELQLHQRDKALTAAGLRKETRRTGTGIYAFKKGDTAMSTYYKSLRSKLHTILVPDKYIKNLTDKDYDYFAAQKAIKGSKKKVFVFTHEGFGRPTSKEYLITDPSIIEICKITY